jgi:uncharacterized protein YaiI (UPF0178 family)
VLHVFVDADACPVKQEVYRVARRYDLAVTLVANSRMQVPEQEGLRLVVVGGGLDEADEWIVEQVGEDDILVSADILLASRCLQKGAHVVGPTGKPFTDANVGQALATRDLMSDLRGCGAVTGGQRPFTARDRSRFLQSLDHVVQAVRRKEKRCRASRSSRS